MPCLKHVYGVIALAFFLICPLFIIMPLDLCAAENPAKDSSGAPNIIICTLGGVRNSETISDKDHQYIPNLWNKMFPQGILYTNLVSLNLFFHQPSVAAINTGLVMSEYADLKVPSIFQYIIKQYRLQRSKVWSVGHWDTEKTVCFIDREYDTATAPCWVRSVCVCPEAQIILSKPELNSFKAIDQMVSRDISPDLSKTTNRVSFSWTFWDIYNELRYRVVRKILKNYKPKFMHFVIDGVDCAHYDTFARYVLAIKEADERIFEIWEFIQNDPFYKDNTFLFVTSDHGRDRYYMQHSEYDSTRQTWLYVYGPKIKKGMRIGREVHHTDIFATIARILNLKTHPIDGKALDEIWK